MDEVTYDKVLDEKNSQIKQLYWNKDNALYFRNALVRANYTNYAKGVKSDKKYLIMFFENLLLDKNNKLDNDELKI